MIAYKGGHIEKDILDNMGLPSVDLEEFGCPKVDSLWSSHYSPGRSCGHHKQDHRQPRRVVSGVHLKIEKGENICNI